MRTIGTLEFALRVIVTMWIIATVLINVHRKPTALCALSNVTLMILTLLFVWSEISIY